jgi:four helix bundle protein
MSKNDDLDRRTFVFATTIVALAEGVYSKGGLARRRATQLLDAGTSVGANVEESIGAQSKPDFIATLSSARKESFESRYWLRLIAAAHPDMRERAAPLIREASELVAILSTSVKHARLSPRRG